LSKDKGGPLLTSVRQIAAQCFIDSSKDRFGKRRWDMEAKLAGLERAISSVWPILAHEAREFVFFGADHGEEDVDFRGQIHKVDQQFGRSLTREKA
jgi:hypothetical protein